MRFFTPCRFSLALVLFITACTTVSAEESPALDEEQAPRSAALVLDDGGIKSRVTDIRIFREQLGFFSLTDVPIEDFNFRVGKVLVHVPLNRVKTLTFEKDLVTVAGFFGDTFQATLEKKTKFSLVGRYEFAELRIDLKYVRVLEFDPPIVDILYCASCKKCFARPHWGFCPFDGNKLTEHGNAKVGSRIGSNGDQGPKQPWQGWTPTQESGIRALVTDDRGKKIEFADVQLFREKLGLLSISQEPTEHFMLKIGKGDLNIPFRSIKTVVFERKTATVTDFDDKTVTADVNPSTKFYLKGRYHFAKVLLPFSDLHAVTFLPPSTTLKFCGTCGRFFAPEKWTHCPYDGTPLKTP